MASGETKPRVEVERFALAFTCRQCGARWRSFPENTFEDQPLPWHEPDGLATCPVCETEQPYRFTLSVDLVDTLKEDGSSGLSVQEVGAWKLAEIQRSMPYRPRADTTKKDQGG